MRRRGDILVDDQLKHAHLWEEAGGIFVHHRDAASTIAELNRLIPEETAADETLLMARRG